MWQIVRIIEHMCSNSVKQIQRPIWIDPNWARPHFHSVYYAHKQSVFAALGNGLSTRVSVPIHLYCLFPADWLLFNTFFTGQMPDSHKLYYHLVASRQSYQTTLGTVRFRSHFYCHNTDPAGGVKLLSVARHRNHSLFIRCLRGDSTRTPEILAWINIVYFSPRVLQIVVVFQRIPKLLRAYSVCRLWQYLLTKIRLANTKENYVSTSSTNLLKGKYNWDFFFYFCSLISRFIAAITIVPATSFGNYLAQHILWAENLYKKNHFISYHCGPAYYTNE